MSFKIRPLHAVDSYKLGHRVAYPLGTEQVYSNFTPRSVKHLNIPAEYKTNEIIWVGSQAIVRDMIELWNEEFFSKPYGKISNEYASRIAPFVGSNEYTMEHIYALHRLGYLPLEIKTLPEGSRVPVGVPVLTITNTNPEFFWLTNYLESYLSAELWKMSTSATIADAYRKIGTKWADVTGGNKDFIDFQFHDFSYRGMSGTIDAAKSGIGHLLSFKGTDSITAIDYAAYHYSGDETFVGASVPAMEHSIQCAYNNDLEYFKNVMDVYPNGIVSIVCDGYDYWTVLTDVLPELKDVILNRGVDGLGMSKVVVRPDSGDPVRIICGDTIRNLTHYNDYETAKDYAHAFAVNDVVSIAEHGEPGNYSVTTIFKFEDKHYKLTSEIEWNRYDKQYYYHDGDSIVSCEEYTPTSPEFGSIQVLWDTFGGTINDKGYKTLNSKIGLIYGDSITLERADEILKRLEANGFASDNVVFGIGSYTYQLNSRDTLGFAMKATNITINGEDIPIFKDPKTDTDKTKKSAKGLLSVTGMVLDNKVTYALINNVSRFIESGHLNCLSTLFKDGEFKKFQTLEEIRNNLKG